MTVWDRTWFVIACIRDARDTLFFYGMGQVKSKDLQGGVGVEQNCTSQFFCRLATKDFWQIVILQKYVLGSVSVLPRQCPATLFRAFPKGGAGRPFLHCTAIYLYLVSQILCQRHSTLRSIPPMAMCYNFSVTSAKDSLKSYFCPISR